jgi:glycosyltransferase involved in cell wall biosynthesis
MILSKLPQALRPKLGRLSHYSPRPLVANDVCCGQRISAPPTISIVVPTYQQDGFIEQTLLSILNQEYPALELVVQDGGSQDRTIEILKKYQHRLSAWFSEPDSGQSQAINRGFSQTAGEIMAWINSDDLLMPGALDTVAEFFQSNPEVDVLYGNRLLIDEQDREIGRWILPGHDGALLSWVDFVPQETLFWRRRIWDKAGGRVEDSLRFAMDWELLLRFRASGAVFAHRNRFLGAFRVHDQQKTSAQIDTVGREEMASLRGRELGRVPSRWEFRLAIAPFILRHMLADWKYAANKLLER